MPRNQDVGRDSEQRACTMLARSGLVEVTRNHRCRGGEIDLVMRDGDTLVFVEVRFRGARSWGGALASVDSRKQHRLVIAAQDYLARNPWRGPCRFDVVAFDGDSRAQWVRNAIDGM